MYMISAKEAQRTPHRRKRSRIPPTEAANRKTPPPFGGRTFQPRRRRQPTPPRGPSSSSSSSSSSNSLLCQGAETTRLHAKQLSGDVTTPVLARCIPDREFNGPSFRRRRSGLPVRQDASVAVDIRHEASGGITHEVRVTRLVLPTPRPGAGGRKAASFRR
ncbi:hypothetical protein Purlil1_6654 [Purpureocillium lilacinum]|uniref:Uncharacterized protein n=1 Tax=Purpureocillium lilacinum TaxID=33203 RepID=A0ABR0BZN6_PURLI|nr:hypothetical protein Purlil1_6654 [Purpureocillium lilacinum]